MLRAAFFCISLLTLAAGASADERAEQVAAFVEQAEQALERHDYQLGSAGCRRAAEVRENVPVA